MKTIANFIIFIFIVSFIPQTINASDWENYELLDRLLTLPGPCAPIIHGDHVVFTADSSLRRVGVAFAHEGFNNVYWFRQLIVPQDRLFAPIPPGQVMPDPYKDSGMQFYVHKIPDHLKEVEYRMIINGLWTLDPLNNESRRDPVSGLAFSVLRMPVRQARLDPLSGLPDGLTFTFRAPPGETVTVAGDFNSWDPFMYELREGPAGVYSLTIPLPTGTYQYIFIHQGRRYVDPHNPRRIYARDGKAASEVVVP